MNLCGFEVGLDRPLFLIAGPCVVESQQLVLDVAGRLKEITARLAMPFVFKASYDKANRSSGRSFRGLGIEQGLRILAEVRRQLDVPVLTDVHAVEEVDPVAAIVDVLQTPAFLCRPAVVAGHIAECLHPGMRPQRPARQHQERAIPGPG